MMQEAFTEISGSADVLLLCGDLTEYGLPEEAEELAADIRSAVRIPCIGVIGNHDYESGHPETVANILDQTGVTMLNGEAVEIAGVGFAGICGFGGGFGRRMLNAWGEPLIKQFVQESVSHAIRLEQALVKLQTERRIVVLHYSPIRATLEGEDPEIYAFLGSSRLEEPINRFRATAVFHGHAHNGITDGKTSTGIPVYNVSAPVLHKTGKPYRICRTVGCLLRRDRQTKKLLQQRAKSQTSAPDFVGETQRTALIASKVTSESGTLIEAASSRRVAAAKFL
jgi:Icc-related predicted phosphoesterase